MSDSAQGPRVRSLRQYRRMNDELLRQVMRNMIPANEAKIVSEILSRSADLYMAEKELAANGVEDTEPRQHLLGEDGDGDVLEALPAPEEEPDGTVHDESE